MMNTENESEKNLMSLKKKKMASAYKVSLSAEKFDSVTAEVKAGLSNGLYKWAKNAADAVDGTAILLEKGSKADHWNYATRQVQEEAPQQPSNRSIFQLLSRQITKYVPVGTNSDGGEVSDELLKIGDCVSFERGDKTAPTQFRGKIVSFNFKTDKIPPGSIHVELYSKNSKTFVERTNIEMFEVPSMMKLLCPCDCSAVVAKALKEQEQQMRSGMSKPRAQRKMVMDYDADNGSDNEDEYNAAQIRRSQRAMLSRSISGGGRTKQRPSQFKYWNEALMRHFGRIPAPAPSKDSADYRAVRAIYMRLLKNKSPKHK